MRIKLYLLAFLEPPLPVLLVVSLVAWLVLVVGGHNTHAMGHSHADSMHASAQVGSGWYWFLMLLAMMTPMLSGAIHHLWIRSLPRRRIRAIFSFVIAYLAAWMLAGAILMSGADQLNMVSNGMWFIVPAIVLLITFIWQASPWRQVCLNHCHIQPRLSPFGFAADRDCLKYGVFKGFWCIGSCWALMFLPLIFTQVGIPLMVLISSIIFIEQYQPARPARWRIPFFARALN